MANKPAYQQPTPPPRFDESRFLAMVAPFTVRVEKLRGTQRMPIPMPSVDEGQPGGVNFDADTIRGLEQWLVSEWAGGGNYEISCTDSSNPPQTMKWAVAWDEKIYPPLVPPPLQDVMVPQAPLAPSTPIRPQQPHQQGRVNMASFPNGLPQGGIPAGYYPQHQQPYPQYQQPPMPPPPPAGSYGWPAWQQEQERRERDNELKRLREESALREKEAIAARHNAEIERERQAFEARLSAQNQQVTELRNMIASMQASIAQASQTPKASAEVEALREANRQTQERLERERMEREAERRESQLREMIRSQSEMTSRQIETLTRQFDDRTRAMEAAMQNNNRPDQLLMMWKESSREQSEAMKELARNQTMQMQAFQSYMMKPQDIMGMARESTASVDSAIERSTNFFGRVIDTQQKVTENLLQMQPSSNGVVDLVGNGLDRVGSAVEKYIGGKQIEAQLAQQSQVQIAEAQARAYAEAMKAQALAQAPQNTNGLGSPTHEQPMNVPVTTPEAQPSTAEAIPINGKPPIIVEDKTKRLGKTDAEWFGPLLVNVNELRKQAGEFIESLLAKPPRVNRRGDPIGLLPVDAAGAIVQAIQICVAKQIPIPAMMELLFQERFADFVDVLLPNVTQPYRDEVTQIMIKMIKHPEVAAHEQAQRTAAQESEPDDDNDDDDDDDDNDDNDEDQDGDHHDEPNGDKAQDGKVIPAKPALVKPRIVTRA